MTPPREIMRTAGEALVLQLARQGVRDVFCVPGESFLPVLDALHESEVEVIVCRHEGGAAMMAEAVGKATGRPGVAFVTRGPGSANALHGVYIAHQDATPMILFVGQVERGYSGRGAWQEIDLVASFSANAKWVAQIEDPARVPEFVSRAFHTAMAGRPGPVVLGLPRDMLALPCGAALSEMAHAGEPAPGVDELAALQAFLSAAQRPFLILGGSRWDEGARRAIQRFAEAFHLPTATSYRRLPLFDPLHPLYAGDLGLGANPKLVARIKSADLVILAGGRLGEVPSQGYTLFDVPKPGAKLVHIHPSAEDIGRVYEPALAIVASPRRFAPALAALRPADPIAWGDEGEAAHAEYLEWSETPKPQPGEVNLGEIMVWLRHSLAPDAVICNGAGAYAAWIHRYFRFRRLGSHVATLCASMGYGVPAAVAMQRLFPTRRVVSINGDGDFLMNGQEFATAVQYELPIVVVVVDNGIYGSIRLQQERAYPGRVVGTNLRNPDFAAYARAFGGFGATVQRTAEFGPAFREAERSGLPSLLHVKLDPDAIGPTQTLSQVRSAALAASRGG